MKLFILRLWGWAFSELFSFGWKIDRFLSWRWGILLSWGWVTLYRVSYFIWYLDGFLELFRSFFWGLGGQCHLSSLSVFYGTKFGCSLSRGRMTLNRLSYFIWCVDIFIDLFILRIWGQHFLSTFFGSKLSCFISCGWVTLYRVTYFIWYLDFFWNYLFETLGVSIF